MKIEFYRSDDGAIAGVCKGLAHRFSVDVALLRLIWIAAFLFAGSGFLFYIIFAISLPLESKLDRAYEPKILGVCSRFAKRAEIEVGIIRASACMLLIFSFGTATLGYFIAHFILPKDK